MALLAALCLPAVCVAGEDGLKTVRVGFYPSPFYNEDRNGHFSGYAYEYHQDIAAYAGWKCEYVRAGWPVLLQMLREGKIDVLSDVSLTPERQKEMLFSANSMGEEHYLLYVSLNSDIVSELDISRLDGRTIAVNKGSVQADIFRRWAAARGLRVNLVEILSDEELDEKLRSGAVVGIVCPEDYRAGMFRAVAEIGESEYYFAINRNRPDLKADLDRAHARLLASNRYYNLDKYRQYINLAFGNSLPDDGVQWLAAHGGTIRMGYHAGKLAFCGQDARTGNLVGALAAFVEEAQRRFAHAGFSVTPVPCRTEKEGLEALRRGEIDCFFPMARDLFYADQRDLLTSQPLFQPTMVALAHPASFREGNANVVALQRDHENVRIFINAHYPQWRIVEFPTVRDCQQAVLSGEADCLVLSYYTKDYWIGEEERRGLNYVNLSKSGHMAFALGRHDSGLLSLLNRLICTTSETELNSALSLYGTPEKKTTFRAFLRDNSLRVTLVALAVVMAFATIFLLLQRARIAEQRARHAAAQAAAALHVAEQASHAKTAFLNSMSHDIRTPMNAIMGFTNLAARHPDNPELVRSYLKKIMVSGEHLLSLINDVLDMSRIESGRMKLQAEVCRLPDIMEGLRLLMQNDMDSKGLHFTVDSAGMRHEAVCCDRMRLEQVLLNCLGNAVKFTPSGGRVELRVRERPGAPEGWADVDFIVADTGIGMTRDFVQHIFEPFSREESSTVSGVPGTGLGMSIARNITALMGGTISVTSEKGRGTQFTISLRLRVENAPHDGGTVSAVPAGGAAASGTSPAQPDGKPAAEEAASAQPGASLAGRRVLLMEDVEMNREIAATIMQEAGLLVETAENGQIAVDMVAGAPAGYYDLICMDVMMPVMDGYEASRRIRQLDDPGRAGVPIIAMTANAFEEDRRKSLEAGMNAHLAKPFKIEELFAIMGRYVSAHPAGRPDSTTTSTS